MKHKNLKKMMMVSGILAICLAFSVADSFGQQNEVFVGSTKSNTKNALTRAETSDDVVKGLETALKGKVRIPGVNCCFRFSGKNERGIFSAMVVEKMPTRDEISKAKDGIEVGAIYVKTDSAELPTGYYIVKIWEFVDRKKNTTYGITLVPQGDVKIQALSIGAKTNGAAGNTNGTGAKFVRPSPKDPEVLDPKTLPQAIIEAVAAFVGTTKSNTKTA